MTFPNVRRKTKLSSDAGRAGHTYNCLTENESTCSNTAIRNRSFSVMLLSYLKIRFACDSTRMCKLSPFEFEIFLSLSEYQQIVLLTSHLLLASVVVAVYSPFNYCRCSVIYATLFAATVAK